MQKQLPGTGAGGADGRYPGGDESEDLLDKAVMRRQKLPARYQSRYMPQLLNEDYLTSV